MKFSVLFWLVLAWNWAFTAQAQLELVSAGEEQGFFGGGIHNVTVVWRNAGSNIVDDSIGTHLSQMSFATTADIRENFWKRLEILPGQTVIETAQIDFPAVRSETRFLIQWTDNTNRVFGKTDVSVYPTNLLAELGQLVKESGRNLGVLDTTHLFDEAIKSSAVKFVNLKTIELEAFDGSLAIIGPCDAHDPEWDGLGKRIRKLVQKGAAIVWILPAPEMREDISPSFYTVMQDHSAVVVVQPAMVANIQNDPRSQLNLIHFCKLALKRQPVVLPNLSSKF